jgi:hypothetical protein
MFPFDVSSVAEYFLFGSIAIGGGAEYCLLMASVYRQGHNRRTVAIPISDTFSEPVAEILTQNSGAQLGLVRAGNCNRDTARLLTSSPAADLFPGARNPEAAVSGLLLLLGCWDESHGISQEIASPEGSYWHGIAHRIEPDSWNSGYWFRRVGTHPIFQPLHARAAATLQAHQNLSWHLKPAWDPFLFIDWCDEARSKPGSVQERVALEIQQAEWELLFLWCGTRAADLR